MASALAGASSLLAPKLLAPKSTVTACQSAKNLTISTNRPLHSLKKQTYLLGRSRVRCECTRVRCEITSLFSPIPRRPYSARASPSEVAETSEPESKQTGVENSDEDIEGSDSEVREEKVVDQAPKSVTQTFLDSYKEAIAVNDENKIREIQDQLQSIEEERDALSKQIASLKEGLLADRERFLRLNADFDNFRKRSERERRSLASNVKREVVQSLLPMVDNFERAKIQIKTETEGEEKINDSYQSIYKQFVQIMRALGVSVVETVGQRFDPTIHEAIMREESTEFEEGIIIEEFRRGFKLGDMLLRPAMVKVSACPGPAKAVEASAETADSSSETAGSSSDTAKAVGSSAETAKTTDSCGEGVAEPDKTTQEPEKPLASSDAVAA